jgi:hypothetical protein
MKSHNRYIAAKTRIILMPIENAEQIGDGPLHIITYEEDTTKTEGRTIWLDSKLLWFKIANLDKNEHVIENQELTFGGENAPFMARDLSYALKYLIERTYVNQMRTGLNLSVDRLDNGSVLIKNGPAYIEVNQEDIAKLADKLDYVAAMGTIGLKGK